MVKTVVVLLFAWVLYQQVFARENIEALWATFLSNFTWENSIWLLSAILLMPLNWALETLKWQTLMERIEKLPFIKAYKAIFAGITFSIFTPNRIGEYGGRILMVEAPNNWKAVVATLVGSFSQLLMLMSFGLVGMLYFVLHFLDIKPLYVQGMTFLGLVLIGLLLFCYFNIRLFSSVFFKIKWLRKYVKPLLILRHYKTKELARTLFFAFLRYITYTIQYYLLLRFFSIEIDFLLGLAGISTIFLLQTSIPLPPLMGLLVRGEVALNIWGYFTTNEISILAATFGVWLINLILPALIGVFFIIGVNVMNSLGFKNREEG